MTGMLYCSLIMLKDFMHVAPSQKTCSSVHCSCLCCKRHQAMTDPVLSLQLCLQCSQPLYTQQLEPAAQLLCTLATHQPPLRHLSPLSPPSPHLPPLPLLPLPRPMLNLVAEAQIMPVHMPTTSQLPMLLPSPLQAPQEALQ